MINQRKAGVLLSYGYIIAQAISVLLFQPLLIRCLGQSEYGLYSLTATIINYLSILDLGLGEAIILFTSKYRALGDKKAEERLHGMFNRIFSVIGAIAFALGIIMYFSCESIFSSSLNAEEISKGKILILILSVNCAATFKLSVYGNAIVAYEKFIFYKLITIARTLLTPLIMTPLLLFGADSVILVLIITAVNIACLLGNRYYAKKHLGICGKYKGFDRSSIKELLYYSFFIFLAQIVDKANWQIDQFILGVTCGTDSVAIYSYASNYNQFVLLLSATLSGVIFPKIAEMITKGADEKKLSDEFIKISRLQLYPILLAAIGFAMLCRSFVIWHAGIEFENAYYVAMILIFCEAIPITQSVALSIIKAKNMISFWACMTLCNAILNIIISIPLARAYGEIGSALGTAITFILANVVIMNIYYKKKIKLNILKYYTELLKMLIGLSPAVIITALFKHFVPIQGITGFAIYAPCFVILYCSFAYLLTMNDYEKKIILGIKNKLLNKGD